MRYVLADAACCPDRIFAARNGPNVQPTAAQLLEIRREVERFRGDVCMQIEQFNDATFREYVCMSQTRTRPAPLHDCSIGELLQCSLSYIQLWLQM